MKFLRATLYMSCLLVCSVFSCANTPNTASDNDSTALFQHPWFDADSSNEELTKTVDFATIQFLNGDYQGYPNTGFDGKTNYLRFYFGNIIAIDVDSRYYIKSVTFDRLKDSAGQYTSTFSPDAVINDTTPFSGHWTADNETTRLVKIANGNKGSSSATRLEKIIVVYAPVNDNSSSNDTVSLSADPDGNSRQYYSITGLRIKKPSRPGVYIVRERDKTYKLVIR